MDTMVKDFENLEMAQVIEEFRRMRQLGPDEEVPEDLLKMYFKYEKQRSILDVRSQVHTLEKLQLSAMYDMVNGDYGLPQPKPVDEDLFPQETKRIIEDENYVYEKDDEIAVTFEGNLMLGRFLGWYSVKEKIVKVRIQGDDKKFRRLPLADIKPYKEE